MAAKNPEMSRLIKDQECIIQALMLRGDIESEYLASKAADICATLILLEEMILESREGSIRDPL